jgi:hypothetical protein
MEKCLICSSTKNLQSHEIHGKNHRPILVNVLGIQNIALFHCVLNVIIDSIN